MWAGPSLSGDFWPPHPSPARSTQPCITLATPGPASLVWEAQRPRLPETLPGEGPSFFLHSVTQAFSHSTRMDSVFMRWRKMQFFLSVLVHLFFSLINVLTATFSLNKMLLSFKSSRGAVARPPVCPMAPRRQACRGIGSAPITDSPQSE